MFQRFHVFPQQINRSFGSLFRFFDAGYQELWKKVSISFVMSQMRQIIKSGELQNQGFKDINRKLKQNGWYEMNQVIKGGSDGFITFMFISPVMSDFEIQLESKKLYFIFLFQLSRMEGEADQPDSQQPNEQVQGIFSFPYQLDTPKLEPFLLNQYGHQALEMPQSVKYLHEIYPLNQNLQTRHEQMKKFFGLKFLFGLEGKPQNDFLEDIDAEIFNSSFFDNPNLVDLSKFFEDEQYMSQQHQHKKLLDELTKKLSEIQSKAFSSISIHKTIGNAFFEHYSNFLKLKSQSTFFQNLEISFQKLISQSQKIKKSGPHLILLIYEFWMRMFRQFVLQIWRHSQKYSQMFKKNRLNEQIFDQPSNNSTSSSQQGEKVEKDRRKPWSKDEIQILEKIISSSAVFNNLRLQKLAEEFGRSSSSISSIIQKIIKLRKSTVFQNYEEDVSIDKKVELILKLNPEGLSKEQVIKKINEMYEMGLEENWKKSVCQILSSKKNILKIKGSFKLIKPMNFVNHLMSQTLKDKLIHCLLACENYEGDLKSLSQKYIEFYGKKEMIEESDRDRIKSIETNISKCLSRYDIFQKTNEKIIYKLNQSQTMKNQYIMDVEEYID